MPSLGLEHPVWDLAAFEEDKRRERDTSEETRHTNPVRGDGSLTSQVGIWWLRSQVGRTW